MERESFRIVRRQSPDKTNRANDTPEGETCGNLFVYANKPTAAAAARGGEWSMIDFRSLRVRNVWNCTRATTVYAVLCGETPAITDGSRPARGQIVFGRNTTTPSSRSGRVDAFRRPAVTSRDDGRSGGPSTAWPRGWFFQQVRRDSRTYRSRLEKRRDDDTRVLWRRTKTVRIIFITRVRLARPPRTDIDRCTRVVLTNSRARRNSESARGPNRVSISAAAARGRSVRHASVLWYARNFQSRRNTRDVSECVHIGRTRTRIHPLSLHAGGDGVTGGRGDDKKARVRDLPKKQFLNIFRGHLKLRPWELESRAVSRCVRLAAALGRGCWGYGARTSSGHATAADAPCAAAVLFMFSRRNVRRPRLRSNVRRRTDHDSAGRSCHDDVVLRCRCCCCWCWCRDCRGGSGAAVSAGRPGAKITAVQPPCGTTAAVSLPLRTTTTTTATRRSTRRALHHAVVLSPTERERGREREWERMREWWGGESLFLFRRCFRARTRTRGAKKQKRKRKKIIKINTGEGGKEGKIN